MLLNIRNGKNTLKKFLQCGMLKRGDFMESFFVALNAVLPMFIMLFIGFLVRKLKILQYSFLPQLNKIVFNVFFPFLMFNNIVKHAKTEVNTTAAPASLKSLSIC